MNSRLTTDFLKPTIITAQQYGTKVSVEIDHSDTDIDELFDAFQTLVVGLGYHESAWKQWIVDRADEYKEEDEEETGKDMGTYEPTAELKKAVEDFVANLPKVNHDEEDEFFGEWTDDDKDGYTTKCYCGHTGYCDCAPEEDTDSYRATQEDEDEFSNDGGFDGRPHFEWGDEEEDIEPLFEGDEWEANENLKAANERYKKEVKKMNSKKRNNKN